MRPQANINAERALVAFITLEPDAILSVDVAPADLICPYARRALTACLALSKAERGTTVLDIEAWTMDNQGTPLDAMEITAWQPLSDPPMTLDAALAVVKDQAIDRRVRQAAAGLSISEEYGRNLLEQSLTAFNDIQSGDEGGSVSIGETIERMNAEYDAMKASGNISTIPTKVEGFDKYRLIEPGGVMVIAGRPSMGKSALAQYLAWRWAAHGGARVLMFTTEVGAVKVGRRFVSRCARVNSNDVYMPGKPIDIWRPVTEASGELYGMPIRFNDRADRAATIALQIRKDRQRYNIDVVIVDHLQECIDGYDQNQEITQLIAALRSACRAEPKIALVLVSQLNRRVEQRPDKQPIMSDLRGSGTIEQAADSILLCFRPAYYATEKDRKEGSVDNGLMSVRVAKSRDGKTGRLRFAWDHHNGYVLGLRAKGDGGPSEASAAAPGGLVGLPQRAEG